MPKYTFLNTDNGELLELTMTISDRDEFVQTHPNMVQQINKMNIGDPMRLGVTKPSEGWRDILRNIKSHHPRGDVNII